MIRTKSIPVLAFHIFVLIFQGDKLLLEEGRIHFFKFYSRHHEVLPDVGLTDLVHGVEDAVHPGHEKLLFFRSVVDEPRASSRHILLLALASSFPHLHLWQLAQLDSEL